MKRAEISAFIRNSSLHLYSKISNTILGTTGHDLPLLDSVVIFAPVCSNTENLKQVRVVKPAPMLASPVQTCNTITPVEPRAKVGTLVTSSRRCVAKIAQTIAE
jgi:hypothetical protein